MIRQIQHIDINKYLIQGHIISRLSILYGAGLQTSTTKITTNITGISATGLTNALFNMI